MALTQHSVPGVTRHSQRFTLHYTPWARALLRVLPRAIDHWGIEVKDGEVRVQMSPGVDVRIPRDSITRVRRTRGAEQQFVRWLPPLLGVHTNLRGVWWLNGSLDNLVAIETDPPATGRLWGIPVKPKRVIVSLDDPDGFIAEVLG